jgi:hypothetical protein
MKFYGFVPDGAAARTACFASMFLLTFAHTLARSFSCALVAKVSTSWLAMYLGGDLLLYYLYKLLRGDLRYFLNTSGGLSIITTVLIRFSQKAMVDFTAFMQLRHPGEAGGIALTSMLIEAQAGCFVCGWLYVTYYDGPNKLDADVVWKIIVGLSILFFAAFGVFLGVMNRDFLPTFFSTDTTGTFHEEYFEGISDGDDESRAYIFGVHPVYRVKFAHKIAAWSKGNWEKWETQKPTWFTDEWIESVPNDCIPYKYCVKYRKTKGRRESDARRGSVSVKELLGAWRISDSR